MYTKQLLEDVNRIVNPNFFTTEDLRQIERLQKLIIEEFESKYVFNDQLDEGVMQTLKKAAERAALVTVALALGAGAATMYLKGDMNKDAAAALADHHSSKIQQIMPNMDDGKDGSKLKVDVKNKKVDSGFKTSKGDIKKAPSEEGKKEMSKADGKPTDAESLYNAQVEKIIDYVVKASAVYEAKFFGTSMNSDQIEGKTLLKQLSMGSKIQLDDAQKTKIAKFLMFMFSDKVSDEAKGAAGADFKNFDKDSLATQNPGYNLDEAKKLVNDKASLTELAKLMKKIQGEQTNLLKGWNKYVNGEVKKAKNIGEMTNAFKNIEAKLKMLQKSDIG